MKRTEITYKKIGKIAVEILDIKNVAFSNNLPKEYLSTFPFYYADSFYSSNKKIHIFYNNEDRYPLMKGDEVPSLVFGELINAMRQAGDKLTLIYRMQAAKRLMTALHLPSECGPIMYTAEEKKIKHSKIVRRKNKDGSVTLII